MEKASELDEEAITSEAQERFLLSFELSKQEKHAIFEATKEQSNSEIWKAQRIGRLTASNARRIYTRMCTLEKKMKETPQLFSKQSWATAHTSTVMHLNMAVTWKFMPNECMHDDFVEGTENFSHPTVD
jgi:hypothetical protein